MQQGFKTLENWKLKGCGAYFAYAEYPFDLPSDMLCKRLLSDKGILTLPETMFTHATQKGTTNLKKRHIRIAYANINVKEINEMFDRLKDFSID